MSLRPSELAQIVEELDRALKFAVVQKVFAPSPQLWYLELRQPGRSTLLCLSAEPGAARISVAPARATTTHQPPSIQARLRKLLLGATLKEIRQVAPAAAVLELAKNDTSFWICATLGTRDAALVLSTEKPAFQPGPASGSGASRLQPASGAQFPYADSAEALLAGAAESHRAEAIRRELMRPLKAHLARIERTLAKVAAEAARGPMAETHRIAGELISQNLERIPRGAASIRLPRYTAEGTREVEVALRPQLPPRDQATWHFHQYRRLQRGSEHAARRLNELREQARQAQVAIDSLRDATPESLLSRLKRPEPRKLASPAQSRPYKEYLSGAGRRIWVGRNAQSNEALTFRFARPQDLWLHARGASGSHVVIPLEKNESVSPELLVDAAHLALHHSGFKGEPRGEVAYTQAKYVRRQKGAPAGTVTVTHEKTFVVRVESDRLKRLLSSQPQKLADVLRSGRSK